MRQFIPMTDELLYRAGGPPGQLVPYRAGIACWHALGADGIPDFADADFAPCTQGSNTPASAAHFATMYTNTAAPAALPR
jgi:hypothetical protein